MGPFGSYPSGFAIPFLASSISQKISKGSANTSHAGSVEVVVLPVLVARLVRIWLQSIGQLCRY